MLYWLVALISLLSVAPDVYRVTVTRKESNLYRIDGTKTYVRTRFCFELVIAEPAILDYTDRFSENRLIFDKGRSRPVSCEVSELLTEGR